MTLHTVRLIALDNEAAVISAVVDDTQIDPTVPVDTESPDGPDPLAGAAVTQISATNNSTRPIRIEVQNVKVTLAPNATRTLSIPQAKRVALAKLVGFLGG